LGSEIVATEKEDLGDGRVLPREEESGKFVGKAQSISLGTPGNPRARSMPALPRERASQL